jgi:hypothetical protein
MLKVRIQPVTGFGKTAVFAGIRLMHYDLLSKNASCTFNLYEEEGDYFTTKVVNMASEELADWGTDDLVLVDSILIKEGFVRDTEWIAPTTTMPPMPTTVAPEVPAEPATTTTTTTEAPEETTTTTESPGE